MRLTLSALALGAVLAAPLSAFDLTNLSEAERGALREEIRAYLLDQPEVLMEALEVLEAREASAKADMDVTLVQTNAEALYNDPTSWTGGNPDGDLRLVEFVDYRCGYCKRAHPEVAELIESDGNIKIIRKELPILGAQSVLASRFAIAVKQVAGDDAYAGVSDALMALRGDVTEDSLREMAAGFDLDWDAIAPAMTSDDTNMILQNNMALAQRLQISGTPTFVLEGQMLRGYLPLDGMRAQVEAVRAAK